MATVGKHEITEEQIRDYVLRNKQDAIPYEALQAIAYDYLNKVIRKTQKFDKWPKEIKDLCYSQGIRQDKETGLPISDPNGVTAWSCRAKEAEDRISQVVAGISKALEVDASESGYCDRYGCDQFQETVREIIGLNYESQ